MAVIRCQACGKPNPDFVEICQYCEARLKPLLAGQPQEAPAPAAPEATPGGIVRCQACGKPNPASAEICQYCDARLKPLTAGLEQAPAAAWAPEPEAEAEPQAPGPAPSQPEPDWMWTGAATQPSETPAPAPTEEEPDWLSSLRGVEPAQPEPEPAPPTPSEEIPDWLRSMQGAETTEAEPAAATPSEELPDWLRSMQGAEAPAAQPEPAAFTPGAAPSEEVPDWLRSVQGAEAPAAPPEPSIFQAAPPPAEAAPDWLSSLGSAPPAQPEATAPSFAPPAAPEEEVPDWLRSMGVEQPAQPEMPIAPAESPAFGSPAAEAEPEWLRSLRGPTEPAQPEAATFEAAEAEPDWLSSLRESPGAPAGTSTLPSVPAFAGVEAPFGEEALAAEPEAATGEMPDWLASMRPAELGAMPAEAPPALAPEPRPAVFGEAAPTAGLEQGALPSWLQAMRPVDVQRPAITPETDAYEETVGVLAGMRGVLQAEPTVALPRKSTVPVHKMEVSEAEAALATLITNLLSEDTQARPASKRRVQLALPLERWAIVAVMLAAILVPYFIAPGLFALPITMGQDTQAAFNVIETLPTDKPALIAFDYEPGQRGELDPAAHAMVAHLMRRGVPVVAVSTRPAGAAVGEAVLQQATTDLQTIYHITYTYGVNYINLGYIPGGPVGVLQFAANPSLSFSADFSGKFNSRATRPDEVTLWQTPLLSQVTGLSQFGLILLVEAAPDSARVWIEQTQAYARKVPMLAAVSAGADPMVRPYYEVTPDPPLRGLVSGIIGATQYEKQAGLSNADSQARWNVLGGGLLAAAMLIAVGNLVYGLLGALRRQKRAS